MTQYPKPRDKLSSVLLALLIFLAVVTLVFSYFSIGSGSLSQVKGLNDMEGNVGASSVSGHEQLYQMVFQETGLPAHSLNGTYGTEWGVKIVNNATGCSLTEYSFNSTVYFWVTNGTYRYYVLNITLYGYSVVPSSGYIKMIGKNYLSLVAFRYDYNTLLFKEKNLPTVDSINTEWYVRVTNSTGASLTQYSQNTTISFSLPAGSYSYSVGSITDFSASNATGSVTLTSCKIINESFTSAIPATSSTSAYIVFEEKGLPYNTTWAVILTNSSNTPSASIKSTSYRDLIVPVSGTEVFYSVEIVGQYFATPDNGVIPVSSGVTVQNITFLPEYHYVNISESGLPSGMKWSVALRNSYGISLFSSGAGTLSLYVPNGTYEYRVIDDGAYHPQNSIGIIYVNGTNFSNLTISFVDTNYSISFSEINLPLSSLPVGTEWSISLLFINSVYFNESPTGSIGFNLPNGTYKFTVYVVDHYIPTPSTGTIYVNGSSVSVSVSFTIYKFPVTFQSTGLPYGDTWYVNITSASGTKYYVNGTAASLSISLVNGTYSYDVQSLNKTSSPTVYSGLFTVNGSPVSLSVSFQKVYYTVLIQETGLPVTNRTTEKWEILVDGSYYNLTTQNLTLQLTNGTYDYTVFNVANFNTTTPTGTFTVHGTSLVVSVKYAPVQIITHVPPPKKVTIAISGVILYILIGIGAVGLIVLFAVYTKGRRG